MTRQTWKDRVLAALAGNDKEFCASELAWIVWCYEDNPPKKVPAEQTLAAWEAWKARNVGSSDSSMRRLCDELCAEGVFTTRVQQRGWFVKRFYSLAVSA